MSKKRIGVVGGGVAGLHMGLALRRHDVDVTIITERSADAYADVPLLNTVAHHAITLERERQLGFHEWQGQEHHYFCHHHHFGIPNNRLVFQGDFEKPSRAVDYRLYLPALMRTFEGAGGKIEIKTIGEADVADLARRFDLVAVGVGKGPLGNLFASRPELMPFAEPPRHLCVGLYGGIRDAQPRGVTLSVCPGECDLIEIPILTFGGMATALLIETVPGSEHESVYKMKYEDDPKAFDARVLALLDKFHPTIAERVDRTAFGLLSRRDLLQGKFVPRVRQTRADVNGTPAIAIGDVHVTMDPCVGQGANVASFGAVVVAEEIAVRDAFDDAFFAAVDERRDPRVLAAYNWTNANLMPPPMEVMAMVLALARDRALCDQFTNDFSYPEKNWGRISSPANIRDWIGAEHMEFARRAFAG
jgi:2-polyprenyl-6-methoxyphenol hydroxylase-like FAD-dependent oxidoreductase